MYIYTGWGDQLWTKMEFSMYRPSRLIGAYGSPEKYCLVCVGLLTTHLFNLNFTFLSDGEMSSKSCGCILSLTGPILWQIAKSSRFKSGK
jgi:hypothetical protein